MDKLALEMAGMRHVISVPDGAPSHAKEGPIDSDDRKFRFLPLRGIQNRLQFYGKRTRRPREMHKGYFGNG